MVGQSNLAFSSQLVCVLLAFPSPDHIEEAGGAHGVAKDRTAADQHEKVPVERVEIERGENASPEHDGHKGKRHYTRVTQHRRGEAHRSPQHYGGQRQPKHDVRFPGDGPLVIRNDWDALGIVWLQHDQQEHPAQHHSYAAKRDSRHLQVFVLLVHMRNGTNIKKHHHYQSVC